MLGFGSKILGLMCDGLAELWHGMILVHGNRADGVVPVPGVCFGGN